MRNNLSIKRQIKENVFRLRADGLSYRQIAEKIGCSKGSINYHLSEGAAEKIKSRLGRIEWRKVWRFCYETKKK
jgi:DNA-directed RNA polymerase specialized sigma24 family protein